MTKSIDVNAQSEPDEDLGGSALKGTRQSRGLSIKRLAAISTVSRRHIAAAESGGNYTVLVLKKLMRAMRMQTISFDDLEATRLSEGVDPKVIANIAEEMEKGLAIQHAAIAALRSYVHGETSPHRNSKAAALIHKTNRRARHAAPDGTAVVAESLARDNDRIATRLVKRSKSR
jgi:transcriptional regulator with XRE-family HTH domain